jgi:hypothetical protein
MPTCARPTYSSSIVDPHRRRQPRPRMVVRLVRKAFACAERVGLEHLLDL